MKLIHGHRDGPPGETWGDWRLGDLAAALGRASEVMSPSAPANVVVVSPPESWDELPLVQVEVADQTALANIRNQLLESEYLPHFPADTGSSFELEINDVALMVWCREGGRS